MLVITNRKLCRENFLSRIEAIAQAGPKGIILREKDLPDAELEKLAAECARICEKYQVCFGINQSVDIARKVNVSWVHFSVADFRHYQMNRKQKRNFFEKEMLQKAGVSIHSVEEAVEMERLGADYLIAGHIYPTNCKKGVPARGLTFLKELCNAVSIPVFAIGGIRTEYVKEVLEAGAEGICVMSEMMECEKPKNQVEAFFRELAHKNL